MLTKNHPFKLTTNYWLLFIPIFLITSYQALFIDTQIQLYSFHELEDFGRYVMLLAVSFAEALLYVLFIRLFVGVVQKIVKKVVPTKIT